MGPTNSIIQVQFHCVLGRQYRDCWALGMTKRIQLWLVTFMYCGNIFYPISGTDMPESKPGDIWGDPVWWPTAIVWRFSFYFNDKGGCLFMDPGDNVGGAEMYMAAGGVKWIIVMPLSVKFKLPSWLFVLNDVKIRGKSVEPCVFGACKASVPLADSNRWSWPTNTTNFNECTQTICA